MNTIQLYRAGMAKSDRENPPTLKSRYSEFKDEIQELVEDKNVDELIDVIHTLGRLVHYVTGSHIVSYLAWPTVKKHAMRYRDHGCIRSKRNCKKYCKHK
jgi:predicted house-cleaning noncanonical NTP pyrophosphatase (MazG superfamily)